MKGFNTQGNHHLLEDDSSEHECSPRAEVEQPTRTAAAVRTAALDPPGSISIQLSRSISEVSFASFHSSPARFDGSGSAEIRSILRKPTRGGADHLGLSQSTHEPSATGQTKSRTRLMGNRSKSERNVTSTCKSKTKRKKDPKQPAQPHWPGSFLADLIAARRSAFVSMDDDDTEETEADPTSPPLRIHTTTAAARAERPSQAARAPLERARSLDLPAVTRFQPRGDAYMAAPASEEQDASDCPFDEDFMILHRRASERSLKCRDTYDDVAVQFSMARAPCADTATARLTECHGTGRLVPIQSAPTDHQGDDDVRVGASSPNSEIFNTSIAQISIDNPSVVDFVPHGCFGSLPGKVPFQPPHEDVASTKPSLCGTIVTTTTATASSEEASSLEDSGSERSQPVHVMVNLSYLELTKASFSDEVCYLVD